MPHFSGSRPAREPQPSRNTRPSNGSSQKSKSKGQIRNTVFPHGYWYFKEGWEQVFYHRKEFSNQG